MKKIDFCLGGSRFVCHPAGWLRQRRFFLCQCFFGSCQQHGF